MALASSTDSKGHRPIVILICFPQELVATMKVRLRLFNRRQNPDKFCHAVFGGHWRQAFGYTHLRRLQSSFLGTSGNKSLLNNAVSVRLCSTVQLQDSAETQYALA
jgi:hypothetical protein